MMTLERDASSPGEEKPLSPNVSTKMPRGMVDLANEIVGYWQAIRGDRGIGVADVYRESNLSAWLEAEVRKSREMAARVIRERQGKPQQKPRGK